MYVFLKIVSFESSEVGEVTVHLGVNRATAILHPVAVYQGRVLPISQVRCFPPPR